MTVDSPEHLPAEISNLLRENETLTKKLRELRSQQLNLTTTVNQLQAAIKQEQARSEELRKRAVSSEEKLRKLVQRIEQLFQSTADTAGSAPSPPHAAESIPEFEIEEDGDPLKTVISAPKPEPAPANVEDWGSKQAEDSASEESAFVLTDVQPGEIQALIADLANDQEEERAAAYDALVQIGVPAVGQLIEALKTADATVRRLIVRLLAHAGPAAKPARDQLQRCLFDDDFRIREDSVRALGQMGADALPCVAALIVTSQDHHWHVRQLATDALRHIPGDHLGQLRNDLGSGDRERTLMALEALGFMGPHAADAAADLTRCLESDCPKIVEGAVKALCTIGVQSDGVVSKLCHLFVTTDASSRGAIVDALVAAGPAAGIKVREMLERHDLDSESESDLLRVLLATLPGDERTAALLREKWQSSDASQRLCAIAALGATGPHVPPQNVDLLIQALSDPAPEVRQAAAEALGELGAVAAPALPRLEWVLDHCDTGSGKLSARVMNRMHPEALVPRMSSKLFGLKDLNALARPAARIAIDKITAQLDHDDDH